MLLVKKCHFFHYLFSLKITLEIGFNNVLQRKELFFTMKRKNFPIFLYLVLVKTRLEIRFNNVLDRKETFFEYKNKIIQSPKNRIFPKGVRHAFGQKMPNFSLCGFGQNKSRKNA